MGNMCCSERAESVVESDHKGIVAVSKVKTLQSDPLKLNRRDTMDTFRSESTQDNSKAKGLLGSPKETDQGSKADTQALVKIIEEEEKDHHEDPVVMDASIPNPEELANDEMERKQYSSAPQAKVSSQTIGSLPHQSSDISADEKFVNVDQQPKSDEIAAPKDFDMIKEESEPVAKIATEESVPIAKIATEESVPVAKIATEESIPVALIATENPQENKPAADIQMAPQQPEIITVAQRQEEVEELFKEAWQFKIQGQKKKSKARTKLESQLKKAIKEHDIRVPIQHHKNNQYIFGLHKVQIDLQENDIMVKYKGETLPIDQFKDKFEEQMREDITQHCAENKIDDLNDFATKAANYDLENANKK